MCVCMGKKSYVEVFFFYYAWFQAAAGGLGMYPLWVEG